MAAYDHATDEFVLGDTDEPFAIGTNDDIWESQ
jgi:hypothetical protein